MGDEDDGQVVLYPHLFQQLEDLCLNGHVQCRGGLVADQDLRVAGYRDGNDHALAHTAGELMRVLVKTLLGVGDAHIPQVFQRLLFGGLALEALMQLHGLHDLVADGLQGIEAGHGVLHDHGDLVAAHLEPVFFFGQLGEADGLAVVGTVVINGAAGNGAVGVQQAHERFGEHALAGAGLAHDGEDFAVVDVQVDAADGMEDFSTEVEFDVEIFDREDQLIFLHRLSLLFIAGGSSGRQRPRRRCRSDRTRW